MSRRIWGVSYPDPEHMTRAYGRVVEEADDERDAHTWRIASGDEAARVVYSDDGGDTWQEPS